MKNSATNVGAAVAIVFTLYGASALAQNNRDTVDAHLIAARTAAGFDFTGTLARLCVAPVAVPSTLRDVAPGPAPARETWFIEPAKVFDNLYFVGSKIHFSWALTTSEGILLIDTLFTYNSEEEIVGGLKKLGLDPGNARHQRGSSWHQRRSSDAYARLAALLPASTVEIGKGLWRPERLFW